MFLNLVILLIFGITDYNSFIKESKVLSEEVKVRAITEYVCSNLEYDTSLSHVRLTNPQAILKRQKAICSEYSLVFSALCDSLGIKNKIITGVTDKHYPYFLRTGKIGYLHNWNIAYINGAPYLIDITWCDSHWNNEVIDEKWYLTEPSEFIKTHYPLGNAIMLLDYYMFERFKNIYNKSYLEVVTKNTEFINECKKNYVYQLVDKPKTFINFIK